MRNFAEAENFLRDASVSAVLLTGRCSKCELFSLPCLKNGEAGDKKWEHERGELKSWLQKVFKKKKRKENYVESEKASTVYR